MQIRWVLEHMKLDIYLDDLNKEYLSKVSFSALFRSRSLGYKSAAELFVAAYSSYNDKMSSSLVDYMRTYLVSKYIIKKFDIQYRDDIVYIIRHPSLLPDDIDDPHSIVRKKVFIFKNYNDPDSTDETKAYEFLNSLRPRQRASAVDRIIDQFMVTTKNEYYIKQAAIRLMKDLVELADIDKTGEVSGPAGELIDIIWETAQNMKNL